MSISDKKKIVTNLGLSRLIYPDSTATELDFLISNAVKLQSSEIPTLLDLHWMDHNDYPSSALWKRQLYTVIVEATEPIINLCYLYQNKITALIEQSFDGEYLNHTKLNDNYKQFMTETPFLRKYPSE
jgi:hypothetical protein